MTKERLGQEDISRSINSTTSSLNYYSFSNFSLCTSTRDGTHYKQHAVGNSGLALYLLTCLLGGYGGTVYYRFKTNQVDAVAIVGANSSHVSFGYCFAGKNEK